MSTSIDTASSAVAAGEICTFSQYHEHHELLFYLLRAISLQFKLTCYSASHSKLLCCVASPLQLATNHGIYLAAFDVLLEACVPSIVPYSRCLNSDSRRYLATAHFTVITFNPSFCFICHHTLTQMYRKEEKQSPDRSEYRFYVVSFSLRITNCYKYFYNLLFLRQIGKHSQNCYR